MAEVYWIHLPEHTDIWTTGYVGVTSRTTTKRFQEHTNRAYSGLDTHLSRSIMKYGAKNLVVEVICICSDEYSLWLENKLRPSPSIGWNTTCGGSFTGEFKHTLSDEHKTKISKSVKKSAKETKEKRSGSQKQRYLNKDEVGWTDHLQFAIKLRKSSASIKTPWIGTTVSVEILHSVYKVADKIYDFVIERDFKITNKIIMDRFEINHNYSDTVSRVVSMMLSGWNPSEDQKWVEDFNNPFFVVNGYFDTKEKNRKTYIQEFRLRKSTEYQKYIELKIRRLHDNP